MTGGATGYRLVTVWQLPAPPDRVWAVLDDVEQWSVWWPGVEDSRVLPPRDGVRRLALRYRAVLGYTLAFEADVVDSVAPERGEARVSGQLAGTGRWRLEPDGDGTVVTWTWEVRPQLRWMRVLSPVARAVFTWAHVDLMRRGRDGLAQRLRAGGSPPSHPPR